MSTGDDEAAGTDGATLAAPAAANEDPAGTTRLTVANQDLQDPKARPLSPGGGSLLHTAVAAASEAVHAMRKGVASCDDVAAALGGETDSLALRCVEASLGCLQHARAAAGWTGRFCPAARTHRLGRA